MRECFFASLESFRKKLSMILVTKLNGEQMMVNAELVELVESTPDTIVTLTTGRKYMVREPVDEIIDRIMQYRRQVSPFFTVNTAPEEKSSQ